MAIQDLPPQSCYDLREADPRIVHLDVRAPDAFAAGHPAGALNVPFEVPRPEFLTLARRVADPAQRVVVSCGDGERSRRAAEVLDAAGWAHVVHMRGGFCGLRDGGLRDGGSGDGAGELRVPGWLDAGLPVAREAPGRTWDALRG